MLKRIPLGAAIVVMSLGALRVGGWRTAAAVGQDDAGRVRTLESAIEQEISRRGGVGATVAVVENGRVLLAKGFGRRAADSPARLDETTLFGVGSVTKQFTA